MVLPHVSLLPSTLLSLHNLLNTLGSERSLVPASLLALTVTADTPHEGTVNVMLVITPSTISSVLNTPETMIT